MSKKEIQTEEVVESEVIETEETNKVAVDEAEKSASLDEEQESSDLMSEEGLASFKAKMEAKVEEAQNKARESEDKFLRTHADFENIKKRLEKDKYQAIDYASEKFAKDLLAPIDALEMALQSANADIPAEDLIEKLKEGIELTIKSFNTAFEKHDIGVVETNEFDPQIHNAVMQVDSAEHDNGSIVQVMQKGYMFKDRLLRPAMVSICSK